MELLFEMTRESPMEKEQGNALRISEFIHGVLYFPVLRTI